MDNEPARNESIGNNLQYEVRSPVSEEFSRELEGFLSEERKILNESLSDADRENEEERMDYIFLLTQSQSALKSLFAYAKTSYIVSVKEAGKLIGFHFHGFDENNESVTNFLGVSWKYRRKGIARQLLKLSHEYLQNNGINDYKTSLWEGSIGVFNKLKEDGEIEDIQNIDKKLHKIILKPRI